MLLGVNIDHIAILREARRVNDPEILLAGFVVAANADQITLHIREDRRHAQVSDLEALLNFCKCPINLECACDDEIIAKACELSPTRVTLVPERRAELTTEGGLNLQSPNLPRTIARLKAADIEVSLFINPNEADIAQSTTLGADFVELHTGKYANLHNAIHTNILKTRDALSEFKLPKPKLRALLDDELAKITKVAHFAHSKGLKVAAGHGLNYINTAQIAKIPHIIELNIGQSIVARAVFVGLEAAIKEMKALIEKNCSQNRVESGFERRFESSAKSGFENYVENQAGNLSKIHKNEKFTQKKFTKISPKKP